MRIISGTLGGRRLRSLPDAGTRPAMARTRESLFSMLEARGLEWSQRRVLDLFAGTGSLAFEALSRGAQTADFVDNGKEQCACLAANIADLGLEQRASIIKLDALKFLHKPPAHYYDLVFIDPPYRHNFLNPCLAALSQNNWLAPSAFVVAEIEKEANVKPPHRLKLAAKRLFGQTLLLIWQNEDRAEEFADENCALSRNI